VELARQQAELAHERASRATAEERLRITRELHDVLGHALSVAVVQAGAAERLLDTDPGAARQALVDIARTGRSSLADIRQVLGRLREDEPPESPVVSPSPVSPSLVAPSLAARLQQRSPRVLHENLHGTRHHYTKKFPQIQRFLNEGFGCEMIQHASQDHVAHQSDLLYVFYPEGYMYQIDATADAIREIYALLFQQDVTT